MEFNGVFKKLTTFRGKAQFVAVRKVSTVAPMLLVLLLFFHMPIGRSHDPRARRHKSQLLLIHTTYFCAYCGLFLWSKALVLNALFCGVFYWKEALFQIGLLSAYLLPIRFHFTYFKMCYFCFQSVFWVVFLANSKRANSTSWTTSKFSWWEISVSSFHYSPLSQSIFVWEAALSK